MDDDDDDDDDRVTASAPGDRRSRARPGGTGPARAVGLQAHGGRPPGACRAARWRVYVICEFVLVTVSWRPSHRCANDVHNQYRYSEP